MSFSTPCIANRLKLLTLLRWYFSVNNNLNSFQFFITLGDDLDYLDGVHTVFAEVVEGFDILDKLNDAICDDDNRPYQDIRLTTVILCTDYEVAVL